MENNSFLCRLLRASDSGKHLFKIYFEIDEKKWKIILKRFEICQRCKTKNDERSSTVTTHSIYRQKDSDRLNYYYYYDYYYLLKVSVHCHIFNEFGSLIHCL